jgi:hypothetical protein
LDSYLKNDSIVIDNTNPRCQDNFPILEYSKGISFEEKLDVCKEISSLGLYLYEINSVSISDSLGVFEEDFARDVFKSREELEIINDLIHSYSNIVKRSPLYLFKEVGCSMDIKSSKDSFVSTFYRNVVDIKGVLCGGLGGNFYSIKSRSDTKIKMKEEQDRKEDSSVKSCPRALRENKGFVGGRK